MLHHAAASIKLYILTYLLFIYEKIDLHLDRHNSGFIQRILDCFRADDTRWKKGGQGEGEGDLKKSVPPWLSDK